jgi:hypothetical protein
MDDTPAGLAVEVLLPRDNTFTDFAVLVTINNPERLSEGV